MVPSQRGSEPDWWTRQRTAGWRRQISVICQQMSNIRQARSSTPSPSRDPHVRTSAVGFSPGYRWKSGGSSWEQLLYTSRGTMSVEGVNERWVVPPTQALWLPPNHDNAVSLSGKGALRRLYLAAAHGTPSSRDGRRHTRQAPRARRAPDRHSATPRRSPSTPAPACARWSVSSTTKRDFVLMSQSWSQQLTQ